MGHQMESMSSRTSCLRLQLPGSCIPKMSFDLQVQCKKEVDLKSFSPIDCLLYVIVAFITMSSISQPTVQGSPLN